jgi:hypothetical protein
VDVTALEEHAARRKLRAGVVLPEEKRKTVSLPREAFVPLLQADVGSSVSISVCRYRVLVPVAQIIRESARTVRRVEVATEGDIYTIRNTLIRHFGGVTVLHQPPAPAFGADHVFTCYRFLGMTVPENVLRGRPTECSPFTSPAERARATSATSRLRALWCQIVRRFLRRPRQRRSTLQSGDATMITLVARPWSGVRVSIRLCRPPARF